MNTSVNTKRYLPFTLPKHSICTQYTSPKILLIFINLHIEKTHRNFKMTASKKVTEKIEF